MKWSKGRREKTEYSIQKTADSMRKCLKKKKKTKYRR